MGLLSLSREVVTEYKADVSEHIAGLEELEGKEAELAAAEKERAEALAEQAESFLGTLAKITLAVTAFKELGDVVWDGYKEGIKEAHLESAALGVDIEALSRYAGGLKTNMELLEFAAKANSSAFHNTQGDMELAEQAMRALEARGVPAQQAFDAVTGAMDNLKVKGLASVGIYVDTTKAKFDEGGEVIGSYNQKLEVHKKVMESLEPLAAEVANGQDNIGDSMTRTGVKLSDSWAELKKGLGQLAESMKPLLESLAQAVGLIAKISKNLPDDSDESIWSAAWGYAKGGLSGEAGSMMKGRGVNNAYEGTAGYYSQDSVFGKAIRSGFNSQASIDAQTRQQQSDSAANTEIQMPDLDLHPKMTAEQKAAAKDAADKLAIALMKTAYIEAGDAANNPTLALTDSDRLGILGKKANLGQARDNGSLGSTANTTMLDKKGDAVDEQSILDNFNKMQAQDAVTQKALAYKANDTMLEKTFGKVGDFDLYKKAFEGMTSAVGTMYDAIVSGSEPAAQAVKKAIGASVDAVGKQMAIESLKEAAYAIGDVAIGDFAGAASHATAAAEFAAGAVIAGVVAHELGAGSSTTPTSGSGSSGSSSSSGGSSSTPAPAAATPPVIVIGDSFANDTARMRQTKAQKYVNLALGTTSAGTST